MEWPEFPTAGRVRVRHKRRPRPAVENSTPSPLASTETG
jgi:hypothetical protein